MESGGRVSPQKLLRLFTSHPNGQSGLLELIVYFSLGVVCMYETDGGNTECGLDRKLVGILGSWFHFNSCSLFEASGGQACSNLALFRHIAQDFYAHQYAELFLREAVLINKPFWIPATMDNGWLLLPLLQRILIPAQFV